MFGGTLLVPSWLEADLEAPAAGRPIGPPLLDLSPRARDEDFRASSIALTPACRPSSNCFDWKGPMNALRIASRRDSSSRSATQPLCRQRSALGVVGGSPPVDDDDRLVADDPGVVTVRERGDVAGVAVAARIRSVRYHSIAVCRCRMSARHSLTRRMPASTALAHEHWKNVTPSG